MLEKMKEFIQFAKEDEQRAKVLFVSESFKEKYLVGDSYLQSVYHQLLLGRNKEQIFDEFLVTIGARESLQLNLSYRRNQESIIVTAKKQGKGYAQGQIKLEGEGFTLEQTTFYDKDFHQDILEVVIHLEETRDLTGHLTLILPRGEYGISFDVGAPSSSLREQQKKALIELYVKVCQQKISMQAFLTETSHTLHNMTIGESERIYQELLELHLFILQEDEAKVETGFYGFEQHYGQNQIVGPCECYYLYLKALYGKTQGRINKAIVAIESYYEKGGQSGYPFWMLCYLEEGLLLHPDKKLKQIKERYQQGTTNELLLFEVCNLYGQDVSLYKELGAFEYEVLSFGLDYQCLIPSVWIHVNQRMKKEKGFYKKWLNLFIRAYEETGIEELLQGICSLLIRGNCMESKYHMYYQKGIEAGVQVIGLLEAYIATIPRGEYPVLNQDVLLYFTYSSSLSDSKRAYLYANIVKNRWKYDDMYTTYHPQMITFLLQELGEMKLSEDLIFLYHTFYKELLENQYGKGYLESLLFYRRITKVPRGIKKVLVDQKELKKPSMVTCQQRTAFINVIGDQPIVVFLDKDENRYLSIPCTMEHIWTSSQRRLCEENVKIQDENHLIRASIPIFHKDTLEETDIEVVEKILACQRLDEKYQHQIFEKLLAYYFAHNNYDKLKENLPMVHLEYLSKENCSRVIELLIQEERLEEAMEAVSTYGVLEVAPEELKKLMLWSLTTKSTTLDETLLLMGEEIFRHKIYNNEIMGYLQKYYIGTLEFMIQLWSKGKQFGLSNQVFLERILKQGQKEKNLGSLLPAFLDYVGLDKIDQNLVKRLLKEYITYCYEQRISFEEDFYEFLGKQIQRGELDLLYQWIYLDHLKDRTLTMEQEKIVALCVKYQISHDQLLPILFDFQAELLLPVEVYQYTYIVYKEEKEKNFTFHVVLNSGKQMEVKMRELVPGYYTCKYLLFIDDIADFYITLPRESNRRRKAILQTSPAAKGKHGRFYLLNQMLKDSRRANMKEQMEQYAYQKAMIEMLEDTDDNRNAF